MKDKLAIFDIDGTLTDSVAIHQTAFIKALENFGLSGFDTNWGNYKHHTDSFIFKTIFEAQFKTNLTNKDIERFENILNDFVLTATTESKIREIKGALAFLQEIASAFDIVFATGSLLKPARHKIAQTGISIDKSLIIAANELFSRDELVLKAIEHARHFYGANDYKQIIAFGDGLWDYETAKRLNLDFIGIGNSKLLNYGVDHFFPDFTDQNLLKLMNNTEQNDQLPNFEIKSTGKISKAFIENDIFNFQEAIDFIENLPYGRNENKEDLTTLFADGRGTCSTKHAVLKGLADENKFSGIQLILGLVKMNAVNTPEISETLALHGLTYIPEAHNYLKYNGRIFDFTKPDFTITERAEDLLEEIEILPDQITDYKVYFHKKYLGEWLKENNEIGFTLDEFWAIREQCIKDLASNQQQNVNLNHVE